MLKNDIYHITLAYNKLNIGILERLSCVASEYKQFKPLVIATRKSLNGIDAEKYNVNVFKVNNNPFCFSFFAIRLIIKHYIRKKSVILRYVPGSPMILFIAIIFRTITFELHGLPEGEVLNRNSRFIYKYLKSIEKFIMRLGCHKWVVVTHQIADFVRLNYKAEEVLLSPNFITLPNYIELGKSLFSEKNLIYNKQIKCVLIASNLSQTWQGIDVLVDYINNYINTYSRDIELSIYGSNLSENIKMKLISIERKSSRFKCKIFPITTSEKLSKDLIDFDCGFAPFALNRKGLVSSAALKTRLYLTNGIPVISPSQDDALSHLEQSSQRRLGFFLIKGNKQFNEALEEIDNNKMKYYSSYKVRYFVKSSKNLIMKSSFMTDLYHLGL